MVIEKAKKEKEDLEYSIDSKKSELNNIKNELNLTKKYNLSITVDNQNMEMIQNVNWIFCNFKNYLKETFRENNSMEQEINNLKDDYIKVNHFIVIKIDKKWIWFYRGWNKNNLSRNSKWKA